MRFEGQTCVLCGLRPSSKEDHQRPECLSPSPRRPNLELNEVPACIKCNVAGSRDDEEF